MKYRIEKDSLGEVKIAEDALWGPQTQRSLENFPIGQDRMPTALLNAILIVKQCAAQANFEAGVLSQSKKDAIISSIKELKKRGDDHFFPLSVFQTGSGTQTNMNVNEVVVNWNSRNYPDNVSLHPNDDVNKSQSTNDVFPTSMRIAAVLKIHNELIPAIERLEKEMGKKKEQFQLIKKIGRTHLMDATPLTLGDEFSAYESQLKHSKEAILASLAHLAELPIGGTAVGNGINAPKGYDQRVVELISQETGYPFTPAENKFEGIATHDSFVATSGALKRLAVALMKMANDIRLLASGPRCGIGELNLPANEPGSSIMPGKVNPTQCEALTMVCCQVIGNDTAITTGAMQGHLQLNAFMPLIVKNMIDSIRLLTDAIECFNTRCVAGIVPNLSQIETHLQNSLMLVTALSPHIGYDKAAKIAQHAHANNLTLKESALQLEYLTAEQFDELIKQ